MNVLNVMAQNPDFGRRVDKGLIRNTSLNEISGIVASRKNNNVLWVHNDSGDKSVIYAINTKGKHLGSYFLQGITARDWEDIALGSGNQPAIDYLYIGDFGDNHSKYDLKYIYRIPEPKVSEHQHPVTEVVGNVQTLIFHYPNGNRNAETLLFDPISTDIYILSKSESITEVYQTKSTFFSDKPVTLNFLGILPINKAVGGDISFSGHEILIKNYFSVFYWYRKSGNTIWETLKKPARIVPYFPEPQGEAICWSPTDLGYYTLSEERKKIEAHLYFYPRITRDE